MTTPETGRQFFSSAEMKRASEEALQAVGTDDCVCKLFGSNEHCRPHHDCGDSVHWLIAAMPFTFEPQVADGQVSLRCVTKMDETLCKGHGPAYTAAWELAETFIFEDEVDPSRAVDMALVTVGPE